MYVLIFIFAMGGYSDNTPQVVTSEFNTFAACKAAADVLSARVPGVRAAVCAAKGEKK